MRTLPFRLGRYTLFDHIASGGMADIYLARVTTELGGARLVVIKEVLENLSADARFSQMLIDEAKLAAQLSHANITRVEELGKIDGRLYIAMEYVEGLDLNELLAGCSRQKIPLPIEFRLLVVREVLRALDYAHRYRLDDAIGIVHRDVSPSNVLLSFDGEVKLCDFGIASAMSSELVPSDTIEGKAGYMSPEHARGELCDERSDLFAAGILLWEALAGRRMYKAAGEPLIRVAQRAEIPPLRTLGLPDEDRLHAVVAKALKERPDHRYGSAAAFFDDLYGYCIGTRQMASALRFGDWLSRHFAEEKLLRRRGRERVLAALDRGPAVEIQAIDSAPPISRPPETARARSMPGARPPMLSPRPPLVHPSIGPRPASLPPESLPRQSSAPRSRPSRMSAPFWRSNEPASSERPDANAMSSSDGGSDSGSDSVQWRPPESAGTVKFALIAFAITFALMSALALTGVIRF